MKWVRSKIDWARQRPGHYKAFVDVLIDEKEYEATAYLKIIPGKNALTSPDKWTWKIEVYQDEEKIELNSEQDFYLKDKAKQSLEEALEKGFESTDEGYVIK